MSDTVNPSLFIMKDPSQLQIVTDPKNIIAADATGNLVRTDYTALKNAIASGTKKADPTTMPTPWTSGDSDLFEKYDVNTPGTYSNFKINADGDSIIIESTDLDKKMVQIWVTNGIAEKIVNALPQATQFIPPFEDLQFPVTNTLVLKIQTVYDYVIYQLKEGETATQNDIPSITSTKWKILNDYTEDLNTVRLEAEAAMAEATLAKVSADAAIDTANDTALQMLASVGVIRFPTQADLAASPVAVVNTDAYVFDTGAWYRSDGTAWVYLGGGILTESMIGIKFAIFDPNRTPAENALYLNSLLVNGQVHVQVVGRATWLVDRSIVIWDDSILDLGYSTLKFSQVPIMDGSPGGNAVISNQSETPYQVNSGIAVAKNIVLRNGTLDVGNVGQAGTSSRFNGYTFVGLQDFLIENITCQNASGYLQWLPGCSYGTVRNTTSINGEENFELAEYAHHIFIEALRSKDSAVNGVLFYQGVHDIIMTNPRIEGSGNGINISSTYGDCHNIYINDAQVKVSGVALLAGGAIESSYIPLASGFTQDPITKTIKNAKGAVVYVTDQRINIHGTFESTAVNAVQTGSDNDSPKGMSISGEYLGVIYGIKALGDENSPALKIRNASLTINCSPSNASSPAALSNSAPVDIDGLEVEMLGTTDVNKRKIGDIGGKSIVRRLREVGDRCMINLHGGILDNLEVSYIATYGANKKIIRGGKFYSITSNSNDTNLTAMDCIIDNNYKSYGNSSGVRLSRLIVMPSATFEYQSNNIIEACEVDGVIHNQNNGFIDYESAPNGSVPTVYWGKIIFIHPNSIWKADAPNNLTDVALWLRAEDLLLSDGDSVSIWTDKSGNAKNAVQLSSSAQPVFKTEIINTKPVVRFDGIDDMLKTPILEYDGSDKATIFIVAKFYSSDTVGDLINSSANATVLTGGYAVYRQNYNSLIGGNPLSSVYTYQGTDVSLIVARIDYTKLNTLQRFRLRVNGVQNNQVGFNGLVTEHLANHSLFLGNPANPLKVDVSEIMVIKREMSDAEVLEAENIYFKSRYGLTF